MVGCDGDSFAGSLESGGMFCVGVFGRNLASVAVKFFHINLLQRSVVKILYFEYDFQIKFCGNLYYCSIQRRSLSSTLTDHTALFIVTTVNSCFVNPN